MSVDFSREAGEALSVLLCNLCESELGLTNHRQELKVALCKGLRHIRGACLSANQSVAPPSL